MLSRGSILFARRRAQRPHPFLYFSFTLPDMHPLRVSTENFWAKADPLSPLSCNSSSTVHLSTSISCLDLDMKDLSAVSNKHSRNIVYPKKRPSPYGVSKSRKPTPPLLPSRNPTRKTPASAKATLVQQRQREAHITALRREGVLLEEEYRDEIRYYMHDMEVRPKVLSFLFHVVLKLSQATHDVVRRVYGSTARNSVAYAPLSC